MRVVPMTTTVAEKLERSEARAIEECRRVLIVAPHFPPSNLAAVHRTRLFAQHLPEFGWEPIVLTVHHNYYEEQLDWDLQKLVPSALHIERVRALPTRPIKLVGDIGIRGFAWLCQRSIQLVDEFNVDFIYIPIPSFYAAPLGRVVHAFRGTPYGIDYIDPWVHAWPPGWRRYTKHWVSWKLGAIMEPFAVREARLITGVAPGYYEGVFERNPHLRRQAVAAAMPYGGEPADYDAVRRLKLKPYLFDPSDNRQHFVYAGAMLPRAYEPLERVFRSIAANREQFAKASFHFIGTGRSPNDPASYTVRPLAEKYRLWGEVVTEHPQRIPYLDVLVHLDAANAVFILGSTEPHYTPSKVFQGVLSGKPILAVLHEGSTACRVVRDTGAGRVLAFAGESDVDAIERSFASHFADFSVFASVFDPACVDRSQFEPYSARSTTQVLANAITAALDRTAGRAG